MPFLLGRQRRIRRTGEYGLIYGEGVKLVGRYLILFHKGAGGAGTRVGITVSGKVGGACERNLVRRRVKEALMLELDALDPKADTVFVAKKRIKDASFEDIRRDIRELLSRVKR